MKFIFMDPAGNGYHPGTPLIQPLGGTESGVAYLSAALARAGSKVTLLNNSSVDTYIDGVHLAPNGSLSPNDLADCDLFVVVSTAVGGRVRTLLKNNVPMVLWCHLDIDQKNVSGLANSDEREAWTGYVMVSRWQAQRFAQHFFLPEGKIHVIGNAVSPAFLEQPVAPAWFESGVDPWLAYASTPYRGLDMLLQCFPAMRARIPKLRLRIHSSLKLYGMEADKDPFLYLYDLARSLPGVEYIGPVSQMELARSMQDVAALAYPSTFMETSCITVMEALACGADVYTTDLGALPETLSGFGHTLSWTDHRSRYATN